MFKISFVVSVSTFLLLDCLVALDLDAVDAVPERAAREVAPATQERPSLCQGRRIVKNNKNDVEILYKSIFGPISIFGGFILFLSELIIWDGFEVILCS